MDEILVHPWSSDAASLIPLSEATGKRLGCIRSLAGQRVCLMAARRLRDETDQRRWMSRVGGARET